MFKTIIFRVKSKLITMFIEKDLQDCLFGLVGWRQNDNPDYPKLPPSLTRSDTGIFFQDENEALLSIENLDQALKNYSHYPYTAYAEHAVYAIGDKVRYSDEKVYEALAVIPDAPAVLVPADWFEVNLFAQAIEQMTRGAINSFCQTMFINKKLNEVTKSIFENVQLFEGAGSLLNKEIKLGRFVGFEIRLKEHRDLTIEIKRFGSQFTNANPGFKLYVFHSSQVEPIKIFTKNLTRSNSFEWSSLKVNESDRDFVIKYNSPGYIPGGSYYIGYYEDELVGQAINKGYNFGSSTGPSCSTCTNDFRYWSSWSKYMDVAPFIVDANDLIGLKPSDTVSGIPIIWDIDKMGYTYSKNYGINLDLSVKCDVTDFFCRERYLFADVFKKQVYVTALKSLAYSTRNNVISKEVRELALFELNNRENGSPGAQKQLDKSIDAIGFDLSDLNDACLPCNEKWGARWTAF